MLVVRQKNSMRAFGGVPIFRPMNFIKFVRVRAMSTKPCIGVLPDPSPLPQAVKGCACKTIQGALTTSDIEKGEFECRVKELNE